MSDFAIEIRDLEVRYGYRLALSHVSLSLARGRCLLLLGQNGAGKSTLLKVLATLVHIRSGAVSVLGAPLPGKAQRVRASIGYLGHEPQLYPSLTALENLRFASRLHGMKLSDKDFLARLDEVGLEPVALQAVRSYSRGMLQRLSLIKVTLHEPELVLLDEPFTGLDTAGRSHVLQMLRRISGQGRTVILTSHEIREVYPLVDRIFALRKGRPGIEGHTAEIPLDKTEAWLAEGDGRVGR